MIKGWDDAPTALVQSSDDPKQVTFIYPYYRNAKFLSKQIAGWEAYSQDVKNYLRVIIVDDGSPRGDDAEAVLKPIAWGLPIDISLFRIDVDVRFNWLAARNIAMHHASAGWCLGTDMDHVVTDKVARSLVYGKHDPKCIYRFSRVEHTGAVIHSHPNSWFMTKKMYWKFGGYDEALSGLYGTDGEARRRWVQTATIRTLKEQLVRYEYVDDSSTTGYKRKLPSDNPSVAKMLAARGKNWKPKILSFPYHEVTLHA